MTQETTSELLLKIKEAESFAEAERALREGKTRFTENRITKDELGELREEFKRRTNLLRWSSMKTEPPKKKKKKSKAA